MGLASEELFGVAGDDVVEGFLIGDSAKSDRRHQPIKLFFADLHDELIIEESTDCILTSISEVRDVQRQHLDHLCGRSVVRVFRLYLASAQLAEALFTILVGGRNVLVFVEPVALVMATVQRIAGLRLTQARSVEIVEFQRQLFEMLLRSEVLDMTGRCIDFPAAIAAKEALLLKQGIMQIPLLRVL